MPTRSADRERFLADIITTAVEGGIGYWSQVSSYRWWSDLIGGSGGATKTSDTSADVHPLLDDESGYRDEGVHVGIEEVARALAVLRSDAVIAVHPTTRGRILEADRANDAGDLDSNDADIVVQVAVLGDVIYG
jgi:hypothetical protein